MKRKGFKWMASALACLLFSLSGCKVGVISTEGGMPNEAYLYFWSNNKHNKDVQVTIDGNLTFEAKVKKLKKHNVRKEMYAVEPGKRLVEVRRDGEVIYRKQLFLSTQETKKIQIP